MTKLQQHRNAMRHGGLSPYFGYILNGHAVSAAEYAKAVSRPITVRADMEGSGADRLIDRGFNWWSA